MYNIGLSRDNCKIIALNYFVQSRFAPISPASSDGSGESAHMHSLLANTNYGWR